MIWIWRFIFGFLTIKISGENCEQFINYASSCGVNIWNLYWRKGCIYGNISFKNFLRLYDIRHKNKCEIKIIKKYGLINKIKKYKNRFGFFIGIIMFFSILFLMTNFIWIINITGNNEIPYQKVKIACKEMGIEEGVLKNKINSKYDAQRLQLSEDEIAWCSFNIEGCVLNINLKETITTEKDERNKPCNIKALIDGKITKIDVTSGNVNVKVGDVVSKGDLLVSGVSQNSHSKIFVHSSGEVLAETIREFSAEGNYEQTITKETKDIRKRFSINFFGMKIPLFLGNVTEPHIYKSEIKNLELFGKHIPIKISKEEYIATKSINVKYNEETLEKMLNEEIYEQVASLNFINANEHKKEIIRTDKGILLKITFNCIENIAKTDEILLGEVN